MRELTVVEQRYQAVLAVIGDGGTVTEVAARFGVTRKTLHAWLARYEAGGLESLADRSHRPRSCPHQMPAEVEVEIAGLRQRHPSWGPRRLRFELARAGCQPCPSEAAVYRAVSFVIHDGESVVEVARRFAVSRQTVHAVAARTDPASALGGWPSGSVLGSRRST